jgi:hypothetical protein
MDKGRGALRHSRAEDGWLDGYQPANVDLGSWLAVRPFVADCARSLDLTDTASSLRIVRTLARLALWALGEGLPRMLRWCSIPRRWSDSSPSH